MLHIKKKTKILSISERENVVSCDIRLCFLLGRHSACVVKYMTGIWKEYHHGKLFIVSINCPYILLFTAVVILIRLGAVVII